jgi:hypothetical protein
MEISILCTSMIIPGHIGYPAQCIQYFKQITSIQIVKLHKYSKYLEYIQGIVHYIILLQVHMDWIKQKNIA